MRYLFMNGTVVLTDRLVRNGAVLVQGDHIEQVFLQSVPEALLQAEELQIIDAGGGMILPGFIDIHVHGGGGDLVTDGTKDAIRRIVKLHALHGTTSIVPTSSSCSDEDLRLFISNVNEIMREGSGSGDILGSHLEGPYFAAGQKGAQQGDFLAIPDPQHTKEIISWGQGNILRVDAAPELPGMEEFARQLTAEGIMVSVGHSDATSQETLRAFDWGFSHITHLYCGHSARRKRDQKVVCGVMEAAFLRDEVTVEIICDGCHVPAENLLMAMKFKGVDRVALCTDAVRPGGIHYEGVTYLSAEENRGNPLLIEDGVAKLTDRSFFAGSITTTDRMLRVAHLDYGIPLPQVSTMMSLTPARLSGCAHRKGSLERGKDADIVVMDPSFNVKHVFVRGMEIVE